MFIFDMCVDKSLNVPIYQQLAECIKEGVKNGTIKLGQKLSQRVIADKLGISRKPVSDAFEILAAEGFIDIKANSGSIVCSAAWLKDTQNIFWQHYLNRGRHKSQPRELYEIFARMEEDASIKTEGDKVAASFSPHIPIVKAMGAVAHRLEQTEALQYCGIAGLKSLKTSICRHMRRYGVSCTEREVLVTPGTGEALILICSAFFDTSINFYYETPSFLNTIQVFQSSGCNMYSIQMDEEGICPDELIKKMRKTKNNVLYIQPTNHLPTGTHMTKKRRDAILSICNSLGVPVIENDMLRDFTYGKMFPKPMKAFDAHNQIIYVGSILSTFMGYKTSWIIANSAVIDRLRDLNASYELIPNNFLHMMTEEMLSSGHYYDYIETLPPLLTEQYYKVDQLLEEYMGDIAQWRRGYPSFFIWLRLNEGINVYKKFIQSKEFLFFPGVFCESNDRNHIRLNIFGVKDSDLKDWIKNTAKLLKRR
jgi:GntR family transcriptional regulator of abcA and norABC